MHATPRRPTAVRDAAGAGPRGAHPQHPRPSRRAGRTGLNLGDDRASARTCIKQGRVARMTPDPSLASGLLSGVVVDHDAPDVLAVEQVVVALVDLFELVGTRDDLVELEVAGLVQPEDPGDVHGRVAISEQTAL